jgi:NADPH2:quinone reductase
VFHAIRIHELGGPEVLVWEPVPEAAPPPGQLVVQLAAAGVNFIDTYHRRGIYPVELPFTPGLEGAGVVTAVGQGVSGVEVGDRVAWSDQSGSYAEHVVVSADRVVSVPEQVDLPTAAGTLLQGMTAHYLVHDTFPLAAGHRCLIHAGAGGVGQLLIQYAKKIGAEVFTTVSTDEKASLAAEAGADHVIVYTDDDFVDAVVEAAGSTPLDVVFDGVGESTFARGLTLLRPRGMMVLYGQSSGIVPPFDLGALARLGSLYVTRPTLFTYVATGDELRARAAAVFDDVSSGSLHVRIGAEFPLAEAAEAHRALEGRRTVGKVLLVP